MTRFKELHKKYYDFDPGEKLEGLNTDEEIEYYQKAKFHLNLWGICGAIIVLIITITAYATINPFKDTGIFFQIVFIILMPSAFGVLLAKSIFKMKYSISEIEINHELHNLNVRKSITNKRKLKD